MRWLLKAYHNILHRYPLTTSSAQTGILVAAGDVIAQTLFEPAPENSKRKHDYKRTFQYFCVGAFYVGPALTLWYRLLDRRLGSSGKFIGLKKMALDQICFAPFVLAGFLLSVDGLRGIPVEDIKQSFKKNYPEVLIANYKLWPAAQVINFTFVPLHYQILYVQLVALFWNTYLCYKTRPDK